MPKRIESDNEEYNDKLKKIGKLFKEKRLIISRESRESFIADRSDLFYSNENADSDWISLRYLCNIETGKNLPSIEMLIKLSVALEIDPVEMFESIYNILYDKE